MPEDAAPTTEAVNRAKSGCTAGRDIDQMFLFGINLFMIRDRDGLTDGQIAVLEQQSTFRCLRSRHIENYFLDENVLGQVATRLCLEESHRDPARIAAAIRSIATSSLATAVLWNVREQLRLAAAIPSVTVRNADGLSPSDLAAEIGDQVELNISKLQIDLSKNQVVEIVEREHACATLALQTSAFLQLFPGKLIFSKLCGEVLRVPASRVREAYLDITLGMENAGPLGEIFDLLRAFASGVHATGIDAPHY